MLVLRPFHLICISKYRSRSYRENHIARLRRLLSIITGMEGNNIKISISTEDSICSKCKFNKNNKCCRCFPNSENKVICSMPGEEVVDSTLIDIENKIVSRSRFVLGQVYDFKDLIDLVDEEFLAKDLGYEVDCDHCVNSEHCLLYRGLTSDKPIV